MLQITVRGKGKSLVGFSFGIQSDQKIEIISGIDEAEEIVTGSYRAISRDLINGSSVTINNDGDESDV